MAYIKIYGKENRQIGEMRIIDGKNVIFNMQGQEVGYCAVGDDGDIFYDITGHAVEKLEDILEHKKGVNKWPRKQ